MMISGQFFWCLVRWKVKMLYYYKKYRKKNCILWGDNLNMKKICAIFCLDEQTKDKIQSYRDALTASYGIPRRLIYPHITLAHYVEIGTDEIIKYSEKFLEGIHAFNIWYDSIEVLSGNCVACIANPNGKITDLYDTYHVEFDSYCDIWTKKENEIWIPHSTIYGNSESKLEEMKIYLEKSFVPFEGKIIEFELSQINEDGFEIIFSKNLE